MDAEEEEEDYLFTHDLCTQDALMVSVLSIGMWHVNNLIFIQILIRKSNCNVTIKLLKI